MIGQPRLTALVLTMNDFSHIYREPEQIELLSRIGEAERALPSQQRGPFLLIQTQAEIYIKCTSD